MSSMKIQDITSQNNYFTKLVLLLFLRNINFAQKRNAVDDDWINEM